jgi:hypothetical protein
MEQLNECQLSSVLFRLLYWRSTNALKYLNLNYFINILDKVMEVEMESTIEYTRV